MKKLYPVLFIFLLFCTNKIFAQGETFTAKKVLNATTAAGRFRHPFAMVLGPDDSLWVTERRGYVIRVNRYNGNKTQLLDIHTKVRFTTTLSGSTVTGIDQDGMYGIALHPELNKGTGNDYVYLAYCYDSSGIRRTKIVRYNYNRSVPSLYNEVTLLKGIPASTDHNSGRLVIGNVGTSSSPNYKLFYTCGDQGANQFANSCDTIRSQYTPTAAQMAAGDVSRYNGKILRLNLDGSIPSDNPYFNGVQTHVYTMGHRNPQGLAFERDASGTLVPQGKLYSCEQGPAVDDEINLIQSGKNYGWPRVAGKLDNNWYRYYSWGASGSCSSYSGECSTQQTTLGIQESTFVDDSNYEDPIFDMYPGTPTGGTSCNWLTNPTVAPSSVAYYYFTDKIPGWSNCLLVSTLKSSALLRLRLSADGSTIQTGTDTIRYFKDPAALNRFRDIVIGSDGVTFYILTDSVGSTSGPSAGSDGGITDPGSILVYQYTGGILAIPTPEPIVRDPRTSFKIYPVPVSDELYIESRRDVAMPLHYIMYDVTGKALLSGIDSQVKFGINVSTLARGVYVIRLFDNDGINVDTQKIIVN